MNAHNNSVHQLKKWNQLRCHKMTHTKHCGKHIHRKGLAPNIGNCIDKPSPPKKKC